MPVAVVTGANSGVGNAFTRMLIDQGYEVHALDVADGPAFNQLPCKKYRVDVSDPTAVKNFADLFGHDQPLHLLLNIAGIQIGQDSLETSTKDAFEKTFAVNTLGPFLLTQALAPSLVLAAQQHQQGASAAVEPKVGIMTSRVGSIADNSTGGLYAYRASKAAVNSIGKSLSVDFKDRGVAVLLLHPGIVRSGLTAGTDMYEAEGTVDPEVAAGELWQNVVTVKGLADTGTFWHRNGQQLPW